MPTSGLGFNDTFGSGAGGSGSGLEATAFSGALDASGFLDIALADSDTYSATFSFQDAPDFASSAVLFREDPDTSTLRIKSANGADDEGKIVSGIYYLTPS